MLLYFRKQLCGDIRSLTAEVKLLRKEVNALKLASAGGGLVPPAVPLPAGVRNFEVCDHEANVVLTLLTTLTIHLPNFPHTYDGYLDDAILLCLVCFYASAKIAIC